MRRLMALIIILVAAVFVFNACADTYYYYCGGVWYSVDDTCGDTVAYQDKPREWKTYMVNYNFPDSVIIDVSALCEQLHGTEIGWLGLVSTGGSNLRTQPKLGNSYRGIQLHDSTTVYIYFSFIDSTNREWYYATTADGRCGYLRANFIQLIPI